MIRIGFRFWPAIAIGLLVSPVFAQSNFEHDPFAQGDAEETMITAYRNRWLFGVTSNVGSKILRNTPGIRLEGIASVEGGAKVEMPIAIEQLLDGSYREEVTYPGIGLVIETFDGHRGWITAEKFGLRELEPAYAARKQRWGLLRAPLECLKDYPEARQLGDINLEGAFCHVVEMKTRDNEIERWGLDFKSGLLAVLHFPGSPNEGSETIIFSDYLFVTPKLKLPFTQTRIYSGMTTVTMKFRDVSVIKTPDPSRYSQDAQVVEKGRVIQAIADKYFAAIGGANAFDEMTSRITRLKVYSLSNGTETKRKITLKVPNRILVEDDTPGVGHSQMGFDGKTAWAYSDVQGYRELQGFELSEFFVLSDIAAEKHIFKKHPFARFEGLVTKDGMQMAAIHFANYKGWADTYYFDQDTGLLVMVEGMSIESGVPSRVHYSDFRIVKGIRIPFLTSYDGTMFKARSTIESVEFDTPVDDSVFTPRRE